MENAITTPSNSRREFLKTAGKTVAGLSTLSGITLPHVHAAGDDTINIALGIMSGVIHGLRLNFIEWYHYSYTGGGKLFNPLKKLTMKEGE